MDILQSKNWEIISWTENESDFLICAVSRSPVPTHCYGCGITGQIILHGTREKAIRDFPFCGKLVLIKLRMPRYLCKQCSATYTLAIKELEPGMRVTARLADYIFRQCAVKSYSEISRETGVGRSAIGEIHVRRMEKNERRMRFPTPRRLGMDGVYINRRERCILTDIEKKRVIGLYESITQLNVLRYLLDLPDRDKVEVVTMDMARSLYNAVRKALPKAVVVIDKYHVQRLAKAALDRFLSAFKPQGRGYRQTEGDGFIYRRDRFLLYRRYHNLDENQRKQIELWGSEIPNLMTVYNLKEKFYSIWQHADRNAAETIFDAWRDSIPPDLKFLFKEILTAFKNWRVEIFNYFDHRVTNAFTEAANRKIKMIQKLTGGCSFWIVRAKILWREYEKMDEADRPPPLMLHECRYIIPKRGQRILRLRQAYEQSSEMFGLMFPGSGWHERFEPYIYLLVKT